MKKEQLQSIVLEALDQLKAKDVSCLDVSAVTDMTDVMIFVTGTSNRHVKSLSNNVATECKKAGLQPLGVEGDDTGEWVLVDLGDILVHVMLPEIRDLYDLEKLWSVPANSADE